MQNNLSFLSKKIEQNIDCERKTGKNGKVRIEYLYRSDLPLDGAVGLLGETLQSNRLH